MVYIRTLIATNVRHRRLWKTTPCCLVLAQHSLSPEPDPLLSASSSPPLFADPYIDSVWTGPSPGGYGSYQGTKIWYAHWIRRRGFDPGYADQTPETLHSEIVYIWVNSSDPELWRLWRFFFVLQTNRRDRPMELIPSFLHSQLAIVTKHRIALL
ncbi:MAG: hypothetical protein BYD32DRAFT_463801 [Podila humilis]|nr:MAG: hypothetical protein BYD32DRAFT_463801 [Podila humilis]